MAPHRRLNRPGPAEPRRPEEDQAAGRPGSSAPGPPPEGPAGRLASAAPGLAAAAAGTQAVLALLLAGRPSGVPEELSGWGVQNFRPEREVRMFLIGVAAALAIAAAAAVLRSRPRRTHAAAQGRAARAARSRVAGPPEERPPAEGPQDRKDGDRVGRDGMGRHRVGPDAVGRRPVDPDRTGPDGIVPAVLALVQALVAVGGSAVFLVLYLNALEEAAAGGVPGWFWGASAALVAAGAGVASFGGGLPGDARPPEPGRLRFSVWDALVPAGAALLLYVPSWRTLAGQIFLQDSALLHWDHFAMAPALALEHGLTLGGDLYPNYGAGWPLLFAALPDAVTLSYGRMIQVGSIYTCLWFAGLYLLLRVVVRRPWLAAAGAGLALLPFFFWTHGLLLWLAPAVTPMRNAFDVWCLLAIAMHLRTGRRGWAAAAGALAGLGVVFHVQAGIVLAAACAFYWLCRAAESKPRGAAASAGAFLAVVLAGAALAGRSDAFTGAFWSSWWDEPLDFLTVPLTAAPATTVAAFAALVLFFLALTGDSLRRVLARRAGALDVFTGTVAFYGLVMLVKFVHYSTNTILPRMLAPAAIASTVLAYRLLQPAHRAGPVRMGVRRGAVAAAGLGAVLLAVTTSGSGLAESLRSYPNLFSGAGSAGGTVCLLEDPEDVCGLPDGLTPAAAEVARAGGALAGIAEEGGRVAVLDETGSLLHLASGTPPFGTTSRVFTSTYTKRQVENAADLLARERPEAVLVRRPLSPGEPGYDTWAWFGAGPVAASPYKDTWDALLAVVRDGYRLEQTIGPYELWRATGS